MSERGYMLPSQRDDWGTPKKLFEDLNREFGFDLDAASNDSNYKCKKHFTIKENGLIQSWGGYSVFINPPYGRCLYNWCKKAYSEKDNAKVIVALLPARTDTRWFHEFIYNKAEIRFLKGRLKFDDCKNSATFPSMIVIWR
jgi:site-specific DNA-methyltransferase (adenine-specific)